MPSRRQPRRERWEAYYSGHVQGVGFRDTTRRLAERFNVTGFVRNLADGRVELVAEGEPSELQCFMNAIAECLNGRIREVKVDARPALDQFSTFDVRR